MARGVVYLARDPLHARLLPTGAAESIERLALEAGAVRPWMVRLFERPWYRRFVEVVLARIGPGELLRLTLRKRFVDDEVREAMDRGAVQLLVVGPGYDTLGLRVAAARPETTVVEVDAPSTAEARKAAIARSGLARANHHLVGADLEATRLAEALGAVPAWSTHRRSVVVAEGVLMYLDEDAVRAFLVDVREATAAGSRLVFTWLRADAGGRPILGKPAWLNRLSLRLVGEPLRWGARNQDEVRGLLADGGFRLLDGEPATAAEARRPGEAPPSPPPARPRETPPARSDLRRRYLVPAGIDLPVGSMERVAVAETVDPVRNACRRRPGADPPDSDPDTGPSP